MGIAKKMSGNGVKKEVRKGRRRKKKLTGIAKKGMAMVLKKGRKGRRRKVMDIVKKRIAKSTGR